MHRMIVGLAGAALAIGATQAQAQVESVTIGVMNDVSGIYADAGGKGSQTAAELAVEDFKAANPDATFEINVLLGDHQNEPDIGSALARRWYESEGVDLVIDLPNSGVALAVSALAEELNKTAIISGAGTTRLTTDLCNANTVHWSYDTYATGSGSVKGTAGEGKDKWFFITADYSFGHDLEKNATAALEEMGYEVVGAARAPLGTSDFSSFILQAQSSGANVLALANAGGDLANAAKQAVEFGLPQQGISLAALWGGIPELHTVGLESGQGLAFMVPFYWNADDESRALNERFEAANPGRAMSEEQSGVYGGTLAFLEGVKAANSTDGDKVVAAMKEAEYDDIYGPGRILANGRKVHDMQLYRAKTPDQSESEWDLLEFVATVPAAEAFEEPSSACKLIQ